MTKNKASLALDRESMTRLASLLGNHSLATGVHCGDDDGDVDGISFAGSIASGVHCGDDDVDG
ncbi:MAG TPA: hypothetical protein VI306_17520 [Pyrinomonadaceae bacterium]